MWVHRLVLEEMVSDKSCFVTLTYADDALPENKTLVPSDAQLFFKRLRKALPGRRIRYFMCGEYGARTDRPHYHAAIFGLDVSESEVVQKAWPVGFIYMGELNIHSARYICRYAVKGWTFKQAKVLNGRHPEFMRCSRRPGIGVGALDDVVSKVGMYKRIVGVVRELHYGKKKLPLGRLLTEKLNKRIGKENDRLVDFWDYQHEMYSKHLGEGKILVDEVQKESDGKRRQQKAKQRIFKKGETL